MPKVSIVLPNYNYARYLDERIQSLLNQTYTDFELIILDDASTDNSIEVIEKCTADPRVKTKFYTENSGLPYKRWNDGADLAQGEYLLIAGADDSCHPTLLEKLVEKLESHPSVGLAFSQSWGIDGEGNRTHSWKQHTDALDINRWEINFVDKGTNELEYLVIRNTIPNASAVLMRRKVFVDAGKFDVCLRLTSDWMLWAKMLITSDISFVAEPLNYFRTHSNTVRSNSERTGLHIEESYQVQHYIIRELQLQLQQASIEQALEEMAENWVRTLMEGHGNISKDQNRKIYKIASSIDPNLKQHLIKQATLHLINKTRVFLEKYKQDFLLLYAYKNSFF